MGLQPLIDLSEVAKLLGMPPRMARQWLEDEGHTPAATYHGRPLYFAATAHEAVSGRIFAAADARVVEYCRRCDEAGALV